MLFMVIERFRDQNALAVYREFRAKGRQMPDGLTFVGSWVTADVTRCFQLMPIHTGSAPPRASSARRRPSACASVSSRSGERPPGICS